MVDKIENNISVKPPATYNEQVQILKSRGLIISDDVAAAEKLEYINYYRLRGYYIHLQEKGSDKFISGTTFEQILSLHDFDNELRILLLRLLLNIEIVAKTRIAYNVAHEWGTMGYRDEKNYSNDMHEKFQNLMKRIDKDLEKSHERFIKTYNDKYAGQFPIWVAVEVMSFGDLSKMYCILPPHLKKNIACTYNGLDESLLTNWIQCSALLRNLCAHNSRIYARKISIPIKIETNIQIQIRDLTNRKFKINPQSLFAYLLAIRRISNSTVWNSFLDDYNKLLLKYATSVEPIRLGFPFQWGRFLTSK